MKKLIILNASLLIVLFSIKFSHENLDEYLRIFRGNSDLASKEPLFETISKMEIDEILEVSPANEDVVLQVDHEQNPTPLDDPIIAPEVFQETSQENNERPFDNSVLDDIVNVETFHENSSSTETLIVIEEPIDKAAILPIPEITLQEKPELNSQVPPKIEPQEDTSIPYPKRILLSHTEGYGKHERPYRTNYSLAEIVFAPDARPGHILPMLDFRGYRFDNGKYAISTGLAFRYIPGEENSFCSILGLNAFYDFAPETNGFHQQVGVGVEILGKHLDFRANFFAPIGDEDDCGICCDRNLVNGWLSSGFNAEVGYLAYQTSSFFLYTAIGPYYVTACKCRERQRGISLRVFPQYKDFVGLNLKYSYDPLFRSIFQAEIIISLPFYQISGTKKAHCGITNRQIYQRIERR